MSGIGQLRWFLSPTYLLDTNSRLLSKINLVTRYSTICPTNLSHIELISAVSAGVDPSMAACTGTSTGAPGGFGLLQPSQWNVTMSFAGAAQGQGLGLAPVSAPPMAALPFSSPVGQGLVRKVGGKRGFDDMMTTRASLHHPSHPYEEECDREGMSEVIYQAAKRQSFGANMPTTSTSMSLLLSSSSAHLGMSGIKAAPGQGLAPDSSLSSSYMPVFKDPSVSASSGVLLQPSQGPPAAGAGARRSMNLSFAQRRRLLQARKSTDQGQGLGLLALTSGTDGDGGAVYGLGTGVTPTPVRATQSSSRASIGVLALQQQPDSSSSSSLLASGTKAGAASTTTTTMSVAQRILDSLRDVNTPAEMARQRPVSLPPAAAATTLATPDLQKQQQQHLVSKASVVSSAKDVFSAQRPGQGAAATSSSSSSLSRGGSAETRVSASPFQFTAPREITDHRTMAPLSSLSDAISTTETTKPVFAFSAPGKCKFMCISLTGGDIHTLH